jgi:hypothetical protein
MIPSDPSSQPLFALIWTDPITHHTQQLTWKVLPQGFRDSLHIFGQALQQVLNFLDLSPSKLIQYVDDLLLCIPSKSSCKTHTIPLLNSLAHWGYQVSRNKAQFISTSVSYMGLLLTPGYHQIPQTKKLPYSKSLLPNQKGTFFLFWD